MAGRLPKEIPYKQYRKIGTLLQDFREYILKPPENRFELLIRCAGQLFLFTEALMSDAAQVAELLDVLRLLRESSGPGVVAAEKTAMERLIWLASECARFLAEEKGKRATSATEAAPAAVNLVRTTPPPTILPSRPRPVRPWLPSLGRRPQRPPPRVS